MSLNEERRANAALRALKEERDLRRENEALRKELGIIDNAATISEAERAVAERFGVNIVRRNERPASS